MKEGASCNTNEGGVASGRLLGVVGDLFIDLTALGVAGMPEWGHDTACTKIQVSVGGSALNTAMAASAVLFPAITTGEEATKPSSQVALFGAVGRDHFGQTILDVTKQREAASLDATGVAVLEGVPTAACICLSGREDRAFVSTYGATAALSTTDLDLTLLRSCTHLHLCGYFMLHGLHKDLLPLLRELKERGVSLSLDPGFDPSNQWENGIQDILPLVDLFFPNEIEAMSISGRSSVQDALEELTKGHDALVVITTGRHGAIAKRGKQVWSHPAFDLPVKDTTGAGDCFTGVFLAQYLEEQNVERALSLASAAGAMSVGREGVFPHPKIADLHDFFASHTCPKRD